MFQLGDLLPERDKVISRRLCCARLVCVVAVPTYSLAKTTPRHLLVAYQGVSDRETSIVFDILLLVMLCRRVVTTR